MLKATSDVRPWIQAAAQHVADYARKIAANWRSRPQTDLRTYGEYKDKFLEVVDKIQFENLARDVRGAKRDMAA